MNDCYLASEDVLARDWLDDDEAAAWDYLSNEALANFEDGLDSGAGPGNPPRTTPANSMWQFALLEVYNIAADKMPDGDSPAEHGTEAGE